ncbi:MAG: GTP-binding protein YchF [Candidatus Gottesmanbacteria bacterium GW2011_GWA1_34_13]|uniref:GTP-binding protein YchF n=1 Tax=Candidatus Gottesmanbacteria bacterium GW2011_GWA1_34_13 TaxID=1618434 RepID=A0A0G0DVZ5_9BACT|nr:MAG: GTP-binding protein YchF [Candidatus Gottesmanbacteria bacterium GW2011_GWA1_34_13]
MNLKVGIVGLPNAGKSTLFNALLKKQVASVAAYPFCTIEPNVGVVAVPDSRLEKLAQIVKQEIGIVPPLVPAVVQFVDIAGLVKGAAKGEGLGNKFLSHIRECDLICHVVREFDDKDVVHVAGEIDVKRDREIIETDAKEKALIADLHLLTGKPVMYVVNVGENQLINYSSSSVSPNEKLSMLSSHPISSGSNNNSIIISAKIEAELGGLPESEQKEYMISLGLEKSGLERLIQKAYQMLGLISFLTAGEIEVKAWTIEKGMLAPQAAGVIHTDFEKGFIKAEVISFSDLVKCETRVKAREMGKLRLEGREYVMQDGDVVEFKVNA